MLNNNNYSHHFYAHQLATLGAVIDILLSHRMNKDSTCHVTCCDTKVFRAINNHWAAAVRRVHMREFFAELVGTFVLIVSLLWFAIINR